MRKEEQRRGEAKLKEGDWRCRMVMKAKGEEESVGGGGRRRGEETRWMMRK